MNANLYLKYRNKDKSKKVKMLLCYRKLKYEKTYHLKFEFRRSRIPLCKTNADF